MISQVLVLLDVTPDEEMQAEGVAREVINRVQKLRKKGHLVPSDDIVVHYNITPADSELAKITAKYTDFIENVIKAKFIDNNVQGKVIIEEIQQVQLHFFTNSLLNKIYLSVCACTHMFIEHS